MKKERQEKTGESFKKKSFSEYNNYNETEYSEEITSFIGKNKAEIELLLRHPAKSSWEKIKPLLKKRNYLFYSVVKYAAIVIITFLTGMYISNYITEKNRIIQYATIDVPYGQMSNITLPDGTFVTLNSGSSLRYPSVFDKNQREIYFKGEGYFHVTENKVQPFFVYLDDYTVKVTGTEFNIQSYPEFSVETALINGQVSIYNKQGKQLIELNPNQMVQYTREDKKMKLIEIDPTTYTQWKNGILSVNNETLESLAKKLERWYNVEIKYTDQDIKNKRLTGTILKYKPFEQIVKILTIKESLNYEIKIRNDKPDLLILSPKS